MDISDQEQEEDKFRNNAICADYLKKIKNPKDCPEEIQILLSHRHSLKTFFDADICDINYWQIYHNLFCFQKFESISNIIQFANVKILDISNCNLDFLPPEINNLHNLRMLNCESNNITNIDNILLKNLNVFNCFDNKLTNFPNIIAPLSCLHIGKNNIAVIPYTKILDMQLIVFLYFDNPFDHFKNNKKLIALESSRQKYLIELYYDENSIVSYHFLEMQNVIKNHENKKININALKMVEESIFEIYYMTEFIDDVVLR
jgi:Leucine-rich repeat (LRR) protein